MNFNKIFIYVLVIFASNFTYADSTAIELRAILQETLLLDEKCEKLKSDWALEKAQLESTLSAINAQKARMAVEIESTRAAQKRSSELASDLKSKIEASREFENALFKISKDASIRFAKKIKASGKSEILSKFVPCEISKNADIYAAWADIISKYKDALNISKTLGVEYIVLADSKVKRSLRIGSSSLLDTSNSLQAARVCDMLENKIPYDFVEIDFSAKGEK